MRLIAFRHSTGSVVAVVVVTSVVVVGGVVVVVVVIVVICSGEVLEIVVILWRMVFVGNGVVV